MDKPTLLPTFFVIGAAKAGTTSLHRYLDAHPGITMTEPKEPHLMVGPGWRERARAYAELFAPGVEVRGDSSPGYSHLTVNPDAPANIAELVPDARLIYMVRDPIERTIAHFAEHVTRGTESKPIERAIQPEDSTSFYVSASRYATVAESYLRHFDASRLLVIDLDELRDRRRESLRRAFAHLGADPGYWDDDSFAARHNVRGGDNVLLPRAVRALQAGPLNRLSRRAMPTTVRASLVGRIRRALGREVRPQASPEMRARLAEALAPEAERLRQLTGRPFEGWSV